MNPHAHKAIDTLTSAWPGDWHALGAALVHGLLAIAHEQRAANLVLCRSLCSPEQSRAVERAIDEYITSTIQPEGK